MNGETSSVRAPRYVHLMKTNTGYGFNLHGEKGVIGQYISAVDKGGPAHRAGLSVGDRVVEVNGVNVEAATHAQVVARIKEDPEKATMLVVDRVTDEYMKKEGLPVSGDFAKYDSVVEISRAKNREAEEQRARENSLTNNNNLNNKPMVAINDVYVEDKLDQNIQSKPDYTEVKTPSLSSQVSNESNDSMSNHQSDTPTINGRELNGRASTEDVRAGMAAALPKPKRRTIKEEKTDNWAAKAALFNNL